MAFPHFYELKEIRYRRRARRKIIWYTPGISVDNCNQIGHAVVYVLKLQKVAIRAVPVVPHVYLQFRLLYIVYS